MGGKKRKDARAPCIKIQLSENSLKFLQGVDHEEPLWKFIESIDLPSQLSALKSLIGQYVKAEKTNDISPVVDLLVDVYWNVEIKSPLKKALSSALQSLSVSWNALISENIERRLIETCSVRCDDDASKESLAKISALLENFSLGEQCLVRNCHYVIGFLSVCLQIYISKTRIFQSPIERNATMADILFLVQLQNKTLQKSMISVDLVRYFDSQTIDRLFSHLRSSINSIFETLTNDTFVADCHTSAAMYFPLFFKWLHKDSALSQTNKYIIRGRFDDIVTATPFTEFFDACFNDRNVSQLPVQSRICLLNGVLAVFDVKDLVCTDAHGRCFLVDCIAEELLKLMPQVNEKSAKLVYSRSLVLLTMKARIALNLNADSKNDLENSDVHSNNESYDQLNLNAETVESLNSKIKLFDILSNKLNGSAFVPIQLMKYSRLHWEDPVDVIRHQARVIFENVICCHLAATKEDPARSSFLMNLLTSLLDLDWSIKSKYGSLCCLVPLLGTAFILGQCHDLPRILLSSINDQSTACYVGELLEKLYVQHYSELHIRSHEDVDDVADKTLFDVWCQTWIDPILESLISETHLQKSSEYIIPRLFERCPRSIVYIFLQLASRPLDDGCLGALVTCLKYAKMNVMLQMTPQSTDAYDEDEQLNGVISKSHLKQALCHSNPQIRLDAFALLCEHNKTTEVVGSCDLDLIQFFLSLNTSNQAPAFRQSLVALLKKVFIRLRESGQALQRSLKHKHKPDEDCLAIEKSLHRYSDFFHFLCKLCFNGLHPGSSFPLRTTSLAILSMLIHIIQSEDRKDDRLEFLFVDAVNEAQILLLINCLNDTFEQNKMAAFQILTVLPRRFLFLWDLEDVRCVFSSGLNLSQSPRPQDCTTAAYLMHLLIYVPNILTVIQESNDKQTLLTTTTIFEATKTTNYTATKSCLVEEVFESDGDLDRKRLLIAEILLRLLKDQVKVASSNLIHAAATKPMYPTLHCLRALFSEVSFRSLDTNVIDLWRHLISDLIDTCFQIATIVSPVVSNSSPEGNIPFDVAEIPSSFSALSVEPSFDDDVEEGGKLVEKESAFDSEMKVRLMPEYLVVCGWRSIKEVSLILGQLTSAVPIVDPTSGRQDEKSNGLLDVQQLHSIGKYFTQQLLESRHRGAFELAYAGFIQMTEMLWRCTIQGVYELPKVWLKEVIARVIVHDPSDELCSTRRSAGVPFYIQALVTTEPSYSGQCCFKLVMAQLLDIASQHCIEENTAQVHARNILRALFRETRLGEDVFPFIADGVKVAIIGYGSSFWSIRNSSTLLFGSLMTRIFGVKVTKRDECRRNYMTGRVFFSRFSTLFEFLLIKLQESTHEMKDVEVVHLHPGLYPILMILGRLCPSVAEGSSSTLNLEELVPFVIRCSNSAVYKIRFMAAQALRPLVTKEKIVDVLLDLFNRMPNGQHVILQQNLLHGLCLQTMVLLEMVNDLPKSYQLDVAKVVIPRLAEIEWISSSCNHCLMTRLAFTEITSSVIETPWPTDLEKPFQELLLRLGSNIIAQTKSSVSSSSDSSRNDSSSSMPWKYEYLCGMVFRSLRLLSDARFYESQALLDLVRLALSSDLYDVQLESLRYLSSISDDRHGVEADGGDAAEDGSSSRRYSFYSGEDETMQRKIMEFIVESKDIVRMVFRLSLEQGSNLKCVAAALNVLTNFSDNHSVTFCGDLWNLCQVKKLLKIAETCPRDEIRISTVNLLRNIFAFIYNDVFKTEQNEAKDILSRCSDLLEIYSLSDNDPALTMACCRFLVNNSVQLLIDPKEILCGQMFYKMWSVLFRLLQDEDESVRKMAARCPFFLRNHPASGIKDNGRCNIQSELAINLCLESFINIHNSSWRKWSHGGFDTLFNWLQKDMEPELYSEEEEIRLFDRGEMNKYRDEISFHANLSQLLETTVVGIVSSFKSDISDDESRNRFLNELLMKFIESINKISESFESLVAASSPALVFTENSNYVERTIDLARNLTAVNWLERILNPLIDVPSTSTLKLIEIRSHHLIPRHLSWLELV